MIKLSASLIFLLFFLLYFWNFSNGSSNQVNWLINVPKGFSLQSSFPEGLGQVKTYIPSVPWSPHPSWSNNDHTVLQHSCLSVIHSQLESRYFLSDHWCVTKACLRIWQEEHALQERKKWSETKWNKIKCNRHPGKWAPWVFL